MIFRLLADGVVLVHVAFVAFVVAGGFLALRWRWLAWLHVPAALWGALIELGGWICPLTPLENALRRLAGEAGYRGGFIEHYVLPVLYPVHYTLTLRLVLAAVVVLLNGVAYGLYFTRSR
jgi:Protein of Unknown function (DUF2784)